MVTIENDKRRHKVKDYMMGANDLENPMNRFLRGWEDALSGRRHQSKESNMTWPRIAAEYARQKGNIPQEQRKELYFQLLNDFLYKSPLTASWNDGQREQALSIVIAACPTLRQPVPKPDAEASRVRPVEDDLKI